MSVLSALAVTALVGWPSAPAGAAPVIDLSAGFDYFANSWGLVGLKDYPGGCRITPEWRLQLADGIEAEFLLGDDRTPLPRGVKRTLWEGLPIMHSSVQVGDTAYDLSAFAVPLPGRPFDYRRRASEDDNFVVVGQLAARERGGTPRPRVAMRLLRGGVPIPLTVGKNGPGAPGGVSAWEGDTLRAVVTLPLGDQVGVSPEGLLTVQFRPQVEPGPSFWLPYRGIETRDPFGAVVGGRAAEVFAQAATYWRGLLWNDSRRVVIPEPKVRETYLASLAYTFIGRDDGSVHPGEGFYDGYFLRDGSYQAWALEVAGYLDEARPSVLETLRYQQPSGQFESQGGELDGNGQALWNLVRHYEMTRDRGYLRQVYPAIRRSMAWLAGALERPAGDPDAAYAGVLPRSWADGEALAKSDYHVVGYDIWNLRGARCAAVAARELGESEDAARWTQLADDYHLALLRLVAGTGARGFPPSLELEGTDWGNLELLFPTRLFDPFDRRVSATLAGGRRTFTEGTIRWCPKTLAAIHPYMSSFITQSHLVRGERERALEGLYAFLLHTTSDDGFPEGVLYPSRTAWGDTIPHLWAAAMYVLLVRNMLIREDGAALHFASAVPAWWLDSGEEVALRRAPTTFGLAGVSLRAEASLLHVSLQAPTDRPPSRLVLHLPLGMRALSALARRGRVLSVSDQKIAVAPTDCELEVGIAREPAPRLSYESTVSRYLARWQAPSAGLRDLLSWPLAEAPEASRCVPLDLRAVANVDPFTAPFGTLNPGKYLFTELATGRVVVEGIPFEIVGPTSNAGRSFVVLQGSETCAAFPLEATIPAGLTGSRAFFLGQVTGWAPGDTGDPKEHAVGHYELLYADGSKQTVPLMSGVTADDWATAPGAQLTRVGLRGDPWHLSILAVKLRAKRLERIVFRDHGTPASPLLAAVTIESR